MFKNLIRTILITLITTNSFAKIDYSKLDSVHDFFVKRSYRQAKDTRNLLKKLRSTQDKKKQLQATKRLIEQISSNDRFDPNVKRNVLKRLSLFSEQFKVKEVTTKAVKPKIKRPVTRAPAVTNQAPEERGSMSLSNISLVGVAFLILFFLWVRYRFFQRENEYTENKVESTNYHPLDQTLLNSILKLTSSTIPSSYFLTYDQYGRVINFSKNIHSLTSKKPKKGMLFKDFLEENFFLIGEGKTKYYINLHDATKFFVMNSSGIKNLKTNIAQFVEVESSSLEASSEYKGEYLFEQSSQLSDILENIFIQESSFKDFNLLDHVDVKVNGIDTCFQKHEDIVTLFRSLSYFLRYLIEQKNCSAQLAIETIGQKHILNLRCPKMTFTNSDISEDKQMINLLEGLKAALRNLAGSLVIKNVPNDSGMGVIQIIFEQASHKEIQIEESFELFEL